MMKSITRSDVVQVTCKINGKEYKGMAEPRLLLVHFLRDELNLTGTHIGCDTGHCGACTIFMNGKSVKSCMFLAIQANGADITTVEGLADGDKTASHPGSLLGESRPAMRVLHSGDVDFRFILAPAKSRSY